MKSALLLNTLVIVWTGLAIGMPAAEPPGTQHGGRAEHIVVVVWDGLRPDFVTPQYAPTLYSLATHGVFFRNHHAAFVSSTEVNGAALATGAYPNRNGILANLEYRPQLDWLAPNATEGIDFVRRGDLLSNGHYLQMPTVAEILQNAGLPTVIAGTKPVALLHDRSSRRLSAATSNSVTLFVAPTVLYLLGVSASDGRPMDGRVLSEALRVTPTSGESPESKSLESTRELGLFRWRQYLKFTEYGGAIYFDEGNGQPTPR